MAAMAAQGEQSIHFPLIFPSIPFSSHPGLLNLFTAALCLLLLFLFPFSPFCYFSALIIPIEFSYFFSFTLLSFSFPHRSLSFSRTWSTFAPKNLPIRSFPPLPPSPAVNSNLLLRCHSTFSKFRDAFPWHFGWPLLRKKSLTPSPTFYKYQKAYIFGLKMFWNSEHLVLILLSLQEWKPRNSFRNFENSDHLTGHPFALLYCS